MDTSFTEQDVNFEGPAGRLTGTLALPPGRAPFPALVLLTGSGAHDRDETVCGHKPFKVISDHFASRRHAVLRFDDRGVGGSDGTAAETCFDDSVADARHAFAALRAAPQIGNISFLGHSEGGLVATEAAAGLDGLHAIVMLAAPAIPLTGIIQAQARALAEERGADAAQIEHERRMNAAVLDIVAGQLTTDEAFAALVALIPDYLRTWPGAPAPEEEAARDAATQMARAVLSPAYRSLIQQAPAASFAKLGQPVLALFGGKDFQVPGAENMAAFRKACRHNPKARSVLFDEVNHLFQIAGTGMLSEYEHLGASPCPPVLDAIGNWLTEIGG